MKKITVEGVSITEGEKISKLLSEQGFFVEVKKMKKALITGVTGQDGAYLSKLLLSKGYEVFGTVRRLSTPNYWRLEELGVLSSPNFHLVEHDLTDPGSSLKIIRDIHPDEVYNLGAQSFVAASFKQPYTTTEINALGVLNLLEAIRLTDTKIRFYQASTSEMFGKVQETPQKETTSFYPRSPYGVAKLFAHWMCINYRESYGMHTSSGILFNHESPLRGIEFVTRKITDGVARIKLEMLDCLELGNLDASRDWGYAEDYVEGMWRMLQQDKGGEYILSTGKTVKVRDFVLNAFKAAGMNVYSRGGGVNEEIINAENGKTVVRINPEFFRPAEVDLLVGDATKAKEILDWEAKTDLNELCRKMVESDLHRHNKNVVRKNNPFI